MTAVSPYYTYRDFLRNRYGTDVYRVPIDLGFGCPHRDDATLEGGCIFCGEHGARATQLGGAVSIEDQVRAAIDFARERYNAEAFIAYFQAYTATHASPEVLQKTIRRVQAQADFRGFVFGTRPDCLGPAVLDVLRQLAVNHDVWVELGLQSANDDTLRLIRRGHDAACGRRAAMAVAEAGINVAAHVILGLPGEEDEHFRRTAEWLRELPVAGIKIHNLHVVKGTVLAQKWREQQASAATTDSPLCGDRRLQQADSTGQTTEDLKGQTDPGTACGNPSIRTWDEHEYGEVLMDFLRRLPPAWPVMRLVSDTPPDLLLAPRWWMSKPEFITYIRKQMQYRGWTQGDLIGSEDARPGSRACRTENARNHIVHQYRKTKQQATPGSSPTVGRIQTSEALAAAVHAECPPGPDGLRLLDIGLGENRGAISLLNDTHQAIDITAIVPGPENLNPAFAPSREAWQQDIESLLEYRELWKRRSHARLLFGDPRAILKEVEDKYDVILLEMAEVEQHPQFHTVEFCELLARRLTPHGVLVSPSASHLFRAALCLAGFRVGRNPEPGLHRGGTMAVLPPRKVRRQLPSNDQLALADPAARNPLRDPNFTYSRRQILRNR